MTTDGPVSRSEFTELRTEFRGFVAEARTLLHRLEELLLARSGDERRFRELEADVVDSRGKHREHFNWRDGMSVGVRKVEETMGERMDRIGKRQDVLERRQDRVWWILVGAFASFQVIAAVLAAFAQAALPDGFFKAFLENLG